MTNQVGGAFSDKSGGAVAERLRAANERYKVRRSVDALLDLIDLDRGRDAKDIQVFGAADPVELETLLRNLEGRCFRRRWRTLLRIGTLHDAQESEKWLSEQPLELPGKLTIEDTIIAIRLRQHIPIDRKSEQPWC